MSWGQESEAPWAQQDNTWPSAATAAAAPPPQKQSAPASNSWGAGGAPQQAPPGANGGGWGQNASQAPAQSSGGWGGPSQAPAPAQTSQGGWGAGQSPAPAPAQQSGGWGQESQSPAPAQGGWGGGQSAPAPAQSGGWGQESQAPAPAPGGWGGGQSAAPAPAQGGWGQESQAAAPAASGGWGQQESQAPAAASGGWGGQDANGGGGGGYGQSNGGGYGGQESGDYGSQNGGYGGQESGGYGAGAEGGRPGMRERDPDFGGGAFNFTAMEEAIPREELYQHESDNIQVESASMAVRSSEYTEEHDETIKNALFAEQSNTGINFNKYESVQVEISGPDADKKGIKTFDEAGFHPHVLENIKLCGYKVPTPVQKAVVPIALAGRDFMACAQTGSGKTAAFLTPVLSGAMKNGYRARDGGRTATPMCLILSPTRELAIQIFNECRKFAYRTGIRPCAAYGGQPGGIQLADIARGCDILVGTPGRIYDFMDRGSISFKNLKYLILDEADRMLDMGFEPQLRQIMGSRDCPPKEARQTMMFSATFPSAMQQLAAQFLKPNYLFVAVGRVSSACENITQTVVSVGDSREKTDRLCQLLTEGGRQRVLIFVGTKKFADQLDFTLHKKGFPCTSIHGDRTQPQRESALAGFRRGTYPIMIATDVASRGLDIPEVAHVVIFDMPKNIEDYVHRIGRTGRAGHTGKATTFLGPDDMSLAGELSHVLKEAGQEVPDFLAGGGYGGYGGGNGGGYGGTDHRRDRY